eukprot:CAMPEP_0176374940 /NCGR_PEP_ID=MMETSP0126-20121128/27140_1 /TAXON_ID=141414 ORGANISM="Strombidinopsis acuminatum, Strain SPMC142" /NCGR_SAMPLE_ID=MMETSP0126 /ASSEMBLY_ACC=CAM_ASM_000229 /LENGTH=63 /DNA_ID=CAMNT_0017735779 /DNA_START=47 /DNA_END=238 /DNA_ORIENTATION=+
MLTQDVHAESAQVSIGGQIGGVASGVHAMNEVLKSRGELLVKLVVDTKPYQMQPVVKTSPVSA